MTYQEALNYYGRQRDFAKALKLDRRHISGWKNRRIPSRYQIKMESLTAGALRADEQAIRDERDFLSLRRAA